MNYYTPWTVDDYGYHLNFATRELLDSFSSIVESMQYHYHFINGRLIPHSIVQLLALYVGKPIFNVLNSAVFVLLGLLIYKISNVKKALSPIRFLFIYLLMFLLLPAFGQTVLWFDGSVNYLWGTTLVVLMMYFFHNKLLNPEKYTSVGFFILTIPLAFLAGGWSENTSAVFLMLEVLYSALYLWTYRKKLPAFYIVDFLVSTASWLIMITAPANSYRRTRLPQFNSKAEALRNGMNSCMLIMRRYLYIFLFMLLALLMMFILIRVFKNRFTNKFELNLNKNCIFTTSLFLLASFVANFVMVVAPYGPRSAFGPVVFMMIALCMAASCLQLKKFSFIAFTLGLALFLSISAFTAGGMRSVKDAGTLTLECEKGIVAQVDAGIKDVRGDAVRSTSEFVANTGLEILSTSPKRNINRDTAAFYGADTIVQNKVYYLKATRIENAKKLIFDWLFG